MVEQMRAIALLLFATAGAFPQTFDAVSVKPSSPDSRLRADLNAGGVAFTKVTLRILIRAAYRVQDFQLSGGPRWMDTDQFDVVAKTAAPANNAEVQAMLRKVLEERFKLVVTRDQKEMPGYVLTAGKTGVKFQEAAADASAKEGDFAVGRGKIPGAMAVTGKNATMEQLAAMLSSLVRAKVSDETGLKGHYELRIEWTPDVPGVAQPDVLGPSLPGALQEQLGLRLEARKVKMDVLVIESAEKPTAN